MSAAHESASFHVGDRVQIDFGKRKLTGVIVEDRGAIGARGRHLFRVDVPMDPFDPMTVELPENEMEAAPGEEGTALPIEKANIIEYLRHGGLLSILRANASGGKNQPRVWLRRDNLGNVTHTFVPDRGVIGGAVVPFWVLQDDRISLPRRDEVLMFLKSFGLNADEAAQVLSELGTAP